MQQFQSEEGYRRFIHVMSIQWSDFEDFKRKYDSRTNPESYAKRMSLWSLYDSLRNLYKAKLTDLDTLLTVGFTQVEWVWIKFKPRINEYRKTDIGPEGLRNFEYLAEALISRRIKTEASAYERMERVGAEHGKIP